LYKLLWHLQYKTGEGESQTIYQARSLQGSDSKVWKQNSAVMWWNFGGQQKDRRAAKEMEHELNMN